MVPESPPRDLSAPRLGRVLDLEGRAVPGLEIATLADPETLLAVSDANGERLWGDL